MRKYHSLKINSLDWETTDSVRMKLSVPESKSDLFAFLPGQHLPMQIVRDEKPVRRTYSICSERGESLLEVGIRVQPGGQFSEYVSNEAQVGESIDVMPPFGRFHANVDAQNSKTYLAFAAGSGITPIIAIMRALLADEPLSRMVLFYGNRQQQTTMFIDDLYALKNRFPERVQLYFLFSQEEQEFEVFSGRLDTEKVSHLLTSFCAGLEPDEAFICGPDTMIDSVQAALLAHGMQKDCVFSERYGAPRKDAEKPLVTETENDGAAKITVIMDGHRKSFPMPHGSDNLVDAAADNGIDLPYSCKGGVCATCRTFVRDGEVRMATNYGLEPWEIERGFVLACQSTPISDTVTIDYDET